MSKKLWTAVVAAVALVGASCDSPVAPVPSTVRLVVVDPAAHVLAVGDTIRVRARATTAAGHPVSTIVFWSIENDTVAQVWAEGASALVEAKAPGTVRITAEAGGRTGRTTITVVAQPAPNPPPVHHIDLDPESGSLAQGEEMTISARPRAADGGYLSGRAIQWSSTDTMVLVVAPGASDDVAIVRARAAGSARVEVTSEGAFAQASFEVTSTQPPVAHVIVTPQQKNLWEGQYATYQVLTFASTGGELTGRPTHVWVEDETVAVIEEGQVRAVQAGVTRIVGESEGVRGYATLWVYAMSQQMTFQLTYDWRDGGARPAHVVGTTTWTDAEGVEREVDLHAARGIFSIDMEQGTWSRVIAAEAYARIDGQVRTVATASYTGGGELAYRWTPSHLVSLDFVESAEPRAVYSGVLRPGELRVGLPVLGGLADYLFRIGG